MPCAETENENDECQWKAEFNVSPKSKSNFGCVVVERQIGRAHDQFLWITERMGKRVSRIDLETGVKSVAVTIDEVFVGKQHEGLLGLAIHPELGMGKDHDSVYVAYTYDGGKSGAVKDRRSKIVQ